MAGNTTNGLTATITSTEDSTQNVPINRGTGNPAYDSTVGEFTFYYTLAAGANVIALPILHVTQLYIKNNDPSKTIQVTWTPNGGASASIINLNPGDIIMLWANPAGATSPGITNLTLTSVAGGALVEFFFGG